jgi:hypothetical protein
MEERCFWAAERFLEQVYGRDPAALPWALDSLVKEVPHLRRRVLAMHAACLRRGSDGERAVQWIMATLRKEATERLKQGVTPAPTRFRSRAKFARAMEANRQSDREYSQALQLVAAIDRVQLEETMR